MVCMDRRLCPVDAGRAGVVQQHNAIDGWKRQRGQRINGGRLTTGSVDYHQGRITSRKLCSDEFYSFRNQQPPPSTLPPNRLTRAVACNEADWRKSLRVASGPGQARMSCRQVGTAKIYRRRVATLAQLLFCCLARASVAASVSHSSTPGEGKLFHAVAASGLERIKKNQNGCSWARPRGTESRPCCLACLACLAQHAVNGLALSRHARSGNPGPREGHEPAQTLTARAEG